MVLERLILIGKDPALVEAWEQVFDGDDRVEPVLGDYFSEPADAMLSPANCFGIMDGGLDKAIREELGFEVERRVKNELLNRFHGELPIGMAVVVPTDHPKWPFLVSAPTMRIPEPVPWSLNAYHAFRGALVAIWNHNRVEGNTPIRSLVCSGLATGIGRMSPRRCAGQMRVAWREIDGRPRQGSFDMIHRVHQALTKAE